MSRLSVAVGLVALLGASSLAGACDLGPVPFHCERSEQCQLSELQGTCEPNGFCSFPEDSAVCITGKKYGEHASEELSDVCVPACVAQVVVGAEHACLRKQSGEVICWGNNQDGRLGTGASDALAAAGEVNGIEGASDLAAGGAHTCAIRDGRVYCWGLSDAGQAGVAGGTVTTPQPIELSADAIGLALGDRHTCVLLEGGEVVCFGDNAMGELGNDEVGTTSAEPQPVSFGSAGRVVELVAGGRSNCARSSDGKVSCWGANDCGKLGKDADASPIFATPQRAGIEGATKLAMGGTLACFVVGTTVSCQGSVAETGCSTQSVALEGEKRSPIEVVLGTSHGCVLYELGSVSCWGDGAKGQLGNIGLGDTGMVAFTENLPAASVDIASFADNTCTLLENGRVVCWGVSESGQLGGDPGQPLERGEPLDEVMNRVACP